MRRYKDKKATKKTRKNNSSRDINNWESKLSKEKPDLRKNKKNTKFFETLNTHIKTSNRNLLPRKAKKIPNSKEISPQSLQNFSLEPEKKIKKSEIRHATINLLESFEGIELSKKISERMFMNIKNNQARKAKESKRGRFGVEKSGKDHRKKIKFDKKKLEKSAKSNDEIIIQRINSNLDSFIAQKSDMSKDSGDNFNSFFSRKKISVPTLNNSKSRQTFTSTLQKARIDRNLRKKSFERIPESGFRMSKTGVINRVKLKDKPSIYSGRGRLKYKPYIEVIPMRDFNFKNTQNFERSNSILDEKTQLVETEESTTNFWEEGGSFISLGIPKTQSRERFKTYNFSILSHLEQALKRNNDRGENKKKSDHVKISKHLSSQRSIRAAPGMNSKSRSVKPKIFLKKKSEILNNLKNNQNRKFREYSDFIRRNSKSGDLHDVKRRPKFQDIEEIKVRDFNFLKKEETTDKVKLTKNLDKKRKNRKNTSRNWRRNRSLNQIENLKNRSRSKNQIYCAETQKIGQNGLKVNGDFTNKPQNSKIKKYLVGKIKKRLSERNHQKPQEKKKETKLQSMLKLIKNFEFRLKKNSKRNTLRLKNEIIRDQTYFDKYIEVNSKSKISSIKFLNFFFRRKLKEIKRETFFSVLHS